MTKKKPWTLPYDVVQVDWVDSQCIHGWHRLEELSSLAASQVITVGFLVSEDKESVTVCAGVAETTEHSNIHVIPRFAIQRVTILKKKER